jgi:hypothetical protein
MIGIVCRSLLRCFKNSMQQAEMSHGMCELGVHLLFIGFPDGVHWQEKRNMRRILHSLMNARSTPDARARQSGQPASPAAQNFAEERTTAMNSFKLLVPKTLWLGIGIATILLGWTPSCKAQEVSPVRFTETGVEDVYPAKPPAKKPAKVHIATQSAQAVPSNQPIGRKQNTHRPARKRNVVFAPGM